MRIAKRRLLALDGYEHDLELLARMDGADSFFDSVYLMGGEPLLHPQIADIVLLTRRYLPTSDLYIATNGLSLASMPSEFWLACKQGRSTILLTRYPIDVDYDGLLALAEQHGVHARFATSFSLDTNDYLELKDISGLDEIDAFRRAPKPACRYCSLDETEVLPWTRSQGSRDEWLTMGHSASFPST